MEEILSDFFTLAGAGLSENLINLVPCELVAAQW